MGLLLYHLLTLSRKTERGKTSCSIMNQIFSCLYSKSILILLSSCCVFSCTNRLDSGGEGSQRRPQDSGHPGFGVWSGLSQFCSRSFSVLVNEVFKNRSVRSLLILRFILSKHCEV